jgi:hypothetical protein
MQGPAPVRAVEEARGMWVGVVCVLLFGGGAAEDQHMDQHGGGEGGGV